MKQFRTALAFLLLPLPLAGCIIAGPHGYYGGGGYGHPPPPPPSYYHPPPPPPPYHPPPAPGVSIYYHSGY